MLSLISAFPTTPLSLHKNLRELLHPHTLPSHYLFTRTSPSYLPLGLQVCVPIQLVSLKPFGITVLSPPRRPGSLPSRSILLGHPRLLLHSRGRSAGKGCEHPGFNPKLSNSQGFPGLGGPDALQHQRPRSPRVPHSPRAPPAQVRPSAPPLRTPPRSLTSAGDAPDSPPPRPASSSPGPLALGPSSR